MSAERRNLPAVVEDATPVKASSLRSSLAVPAAIASAGDHAACRFIEFFAATIRNKNTRLAYYRAACNFFAWLETQMSLADIALQINPLLRGWIEYYGRYAPSALAPVLRYVNQPPFPG